MHTYLKYLLRKEDSVSLKGLGTFKAKTKSAQIKDNVLLPPSREVEFHDVALESSSHSLLDLIKENEGLSEEQASKKIEDYSLEVKKQISAFDKYKLAGLGHLSRNANSKINFHAEDTAFLQDEAFGLPSLPLKKVKTDVHIEKEANRKNNLFIITVVVIPLTIILVFLSVLMFHPPTREKVFSFFTKKRNTVDSVEVKKDDSSQNNLANHNVVKIDSPKSNDPGKTPVDDPKNNSNDVKKDPVDKNPVDKNPVDKEPKTNPVNDNPNAGNVVEDMQKNGFYIIVGSYAEEKGAKKAIKQLRDKGHNNALMLKAPNNKIRVGLGIYSSQKEADAALPSLSGSFNGAWVLKG